MGDKYSWQRSRKYDEYDSVGSGFDCQWICYIFHCVFLLHATFFFRKKKLHVQIRKVFFAFIPIQKAEAFLKILFSDLSDICKFPYGAVCRSCDSWKYVCRYTQYFKNAICTFDRNFNCIYCLIPIFGAFIGCAVGCFLIFMVSPKQAILFIIVFLILQQIEGNLIYPHVVGGSVGLPSIWVLAAVTVGGNLMGIVGMLIFYSISFSFVHYFQGICISSSEGKNIKQVTKTVVEEYTAEEIAAMEKNIKKNRE